jgi:NADPH-dependent ferric siderophore reductase
MTTGTPIRREPPPFRRVAVAAAADLGPRLRRITLGGAALDGFPMPEPAASVRLLLPSPGAALEIPAWNGNEFLSAAGTRPVLRTLTPRFVRVSELDVDVVLHDGGRLSAWAASVTPGVEVAVSGPGRGYDIPATNVMLVAGDETAIPAISQLLETFGPDVAISVIIEVATSDGEVPLPAHPRAAVTWVRATSGAAPGSALVDAVTAAALDPETRVWAAGEAGAVQRIRKYLFDERGFARRDAVVRGYWKHGRAET